MTDTGSCFCWTCGNVFDTTAALDAHQLETGHEMGQENHPLNQPGNRPRFEAADRRNTSTRAA